MLSRWKGASAIGLESEQAREKRLAARQRRQLREQEVTRLRQEQCRIWQAVERMQGEIERARSGRAAAAAAGGGVVRVEPRRD